MSEQEQASAVESGRLEQGDDIQIVKELNDAYKEMTDQLGHVIVGQTHVIEQVLISMFCRGHVLLVGVPGLAKTLLVSTIAQSLRLDFSRIQFTPDLMPSDITGTDVLEEDRTTGKRVFRFLKGPLFTNMVLADEINRTPPKTQAALLEAMQEHRVTVGEETYELAEPFFVMATQNPIEQEGTYPLPEAQLDRFLVQLNLGYPDPESELNILFSQAERDPLEDIEPVLSREDVIAMQQDVRTIAFDQSVARYLVDMVERSRNDSRLKLGVSPRGSLMLFRAAQASAYMAGRGYVLPDDVQRLAPFVLAHRIVLTSKARYGHQSQHDILADIPQQVPVPT